MSNPIQTIKHDAPKESQTFFGAPTVLCPGCGARVYLDPEDRIVAHGNLATQCPLSGAAVPHHFLDCARGGCEDCRDDDDPELRGTSHAPLIGEAIPEVRS